jgi:hypothetical protein
MSANMLLYEKESTRTAQDGEVLDGTAGLVAYDKGGSITTNGSNFKFTPAEKDRNDDGKVDDEDMQIYYLETPVSATMSNGEKNPVQFRITEATIYYTKISSDAFYIKYIDGDTPYYLGTDNGQFKTTPTPWSMDDDGHIFSGSDYLTVNNSWAETTRTKNDATTFTIEGGIIKDANGNTLKYFSYNYYGNRYRYGYFTNAETLGDGYNSYDVYPAEVEAMETSTSTVPDYTIYVYDKEGNTKQKIDGLDRNINDLDSKIQDREDFSKYVKDLEYIYNDFRTLDDDIDNIVDVEKKKELKDSLDNLKIIMLDLISD